VMNTLFFFLVKSKCSDKHMLCSKTLARRKQKTSWSFLSAAAIYYEVVHDVYEYLL
jgi:hypothetical protein